MPNCTFYPSKGLMIEGVALQLGFQPISLPMRSENLLRPSHEYPLAIGEALIIRHFGKPWLPDKPFMRQLPALFSNPKAMARPSH
jgi:hypothetical protein